MRTTTRPPLSSRKRLEAELSHRATDTLGIAAFAAALVMIVALALGNAGVLGSALGGFFSLLFGRGAWAVPGVLILFGVAFFAGRPSLELSRLTWGALLIFAAVVGAFARDLRGDYFDPEIVSISGGYLGAIIGWAVLTGGTTAWAIAIGAIAIIAVGQLLKYLIPGKQMKASGVPNWVLVVGGAGAVIGFFVIPVVGLVIGFIAGVFLAEAIRLKTFKNAWPTTVQAMKSAGWSVSTRS